MQIRLKLTILYSSILAITVFAMGLAVYGMLCQRSKMMLKDEMTVTADEIMETIEGSRAILPLERNLESPMSEHYRNFFELGDGTIDHFNPLDILFNDGLIGRNYDLFWDETDLFQGQSSQELENIFRNRGRSIFDIVNILDVEERLIYNPIQRNSQTIPLSQKLKNDLSEIKRDAWQESSIDGIPCLVLIRPVFSKGNLLGYIQVARPLNTTNELLRALIRVMTLIGVVSILISAAAGWFLSGYALKRIDTVTQTVSGIRQEQDFSKRVEYRGPHDEIGRLTLAFNEMLENIQSTYGQLKNTLEQQKNFVADVSHELRTPLTTIRGNLALLDSKRIISDGDRSEIVGDMVQETDRLIKLVNDLLTLARADINEPLSFARIQLRQIVDEAIRMLSSLDPHRIVTIDIPEDFYVFSEKTKLKQALIILIDNAYKHSDTAITVRAEHHSGRDLVSVIDYGKGISPEDLSRIFVRFGRGGKNDGNGFGLGLPIAKSLMKALNGTIEVNSAPYVETKFTLVFRKGDSPAENKN